MGALQNQADQQRDENRFNRKNNSLLRNMPFDVEITDQSSIAMYNMSKSELLSKYNADVHAWGEKVKSQLIASINSNNIKGRNLIASLRANYTLGKTYGDIWKVTYNFLPEGVYVHLGVGKGYQMSGGVVNKTSKADTWNRKPKKWFNPVVDRHMPELQDIVSRYFETAVVNSVRIFIGKNN